MTVSRRSVRDAGGLPERGPDVHDRCMGELTGLLAAVRAGEPGAVDGVVAITYRELRALAHQRLARAPTITLLDTTSLVHECYLRLVKVGELQTDDRGHFMAYAARAMRSVIVDFARQRAAQRRGGNEVHVTLDPEIADDGAEGAAELLRIGAALDELAGLDERLAQVVELKYFAGLTNEEVAAALGVNERTVRRDWDKARALLYQALQA
jgi:RNA polymerase sigma factor (TIGR02999 family)